MALSFILVFAALIRLYGITWGLPSKTSSLTTYHPDEAFLFQALEFMHKGRSLRPPKIALHYGTFHFYLSGAVLFAAKAAGIVQLGSRDFLLEDLSRADRLYLVVRILSVIFVVLAVAGTYFLGGRVFGGDAGLLAAFLLAASPGAVSIAHYGKLDSLLPLLVVGLLWSSLNLSESLTAKNAWICGILTGLIAGTRYNCGILIVVPLATLWMNRPPHLVRLAGFIVLGSLATFLAVTPYALLDFKTFAAGLHHMGTFVTAHTAPGFRDSRWYNPIYVFTDMIPFNLSWPAAFFFIYGVYSAVKRGLSGPEKILLTAIAGVFALLCVSNVRYSHYLAPILPVIALFAAFGLAQIRFWRWGRALVAAALVFQGLTAAAFASLYAGPNPRELAGEWLLTRVKPGQSVGMVRNYFWTPGALRSKDLPFPLVKAGDEQSEITDDFLKLPAIKPLPVFFLLSDLELRSAKGLSRAQGKPFDETLLGFLANYRLTATFQLKPRIFGRALWRREPPWDLQLIAPTLWVFERSKTP